jgi:hypothetical protein
MTPKKFVIAFFVWMLWFACMLCGVFTAGGIAAYIFGGGEYGSLAVIQDRTNPGFWIFIILLVPFMLVGAAGGLAAIVLPAYCYFRIPMRRKGRPVGWLDSYLKTVNKMLENEW